MSAELTLESSSLLPRHKIERGAEKNKLPSFGVYWRDTSMKCCHIEAE